MCGYDWFDSLTAPRSRMDAMDENQYRAPSEQGIASTRRIGLLPYDSFVLHSSAPASALMERLKGHVVHLGGDIAKKAFVGELTTRGFTLYRLRSGARNDGRPTLCGRLEMEAGGTRVRVRMRLHWFAIAFLACWFGLCVAMAIGDARLHGLRIVTFAAPVGIFCSSTC